MTPLATSRKAPLGELLVSEGLITAAQKDDALAASRASGRRLGEVLVESGAIIEADMHRVLARQAGLPFLDLRKGLVDADIVHVLPQEQARQYEVLPLFRIHGRLVLAISDPNNVLMTDTIRKLTGLDVEPVVCLRDQILTMIDEVYEPQDGAFADLLPDFEADDLELVAQVSDQIEDIAEMAGESPIINLVNQIILRGMQDRASDIHIEPEHQYMRVRFRIDGMLYEIMRQRVDLLAPVVSRLKLMANLDIAERRLPQDGRIQVRAQGRQIDLRLSTLPGVVGEKVVLRVLDKQGGVLGLDELGFSPDTLSAFRALLHRPHGMVLVTGPTGSGKTTTLYAGLRELNSLEKNIVTIEDPVEYQFEIINQNQVKEDIGLSFARILKATLRQDPDVLMVGEIRDPETARIAVQAALTGHLVLTTMHTNDAASSITRLLEIGVEPYLLAPSLIGVIGQRLVRTNCPECTAAYYPTTAEIEALGLPAADDRRLYRGRGCPQCFDSGYRGRLGVYELLISNQRFENLLLQRPSLEEIRHFQDDRQLPTLRSEATRLVLEGRTTLEEIGRAVATD